MSDGFSLLAATKGCCLMSKKIPKNIQNVYRKPVIGTFADSKKSLLLYRFVYGSTISFAVVALLLLSFFVQGVEKIYADELVVEVKQTTRPATDLDIGAELDEEQINEEIIGSQENPSVFDTEIQDSAADGDVESEPEVSVDNDTPETEVGDSEDVLTEDTETQLIDEVASSTETQEEIALEENVTFESAVNITESDSEFSFNRNECTQLATGSFYCHQPQENVLDDALFAAPDEDGDLEIFLVRGGVQTKVTNNEMDDASPYFDQNTDTLVWHRLIEDRYQIMELDIDSGEEQQLTRTSDNNMEPTRQGKYTVWQRWVDGGWNIILSDGVSEKQLTKTISHNIAPYVHGSLVVWNRYSTTNDKTIEMYDIDSETYVSVDDPDGMSVSNPRMVFVYDSLHPNGDIVTKGYDILARKFIDLDTLPRDLPEELPSSDSTGETRALIQSKPSLKSDAEESLEGIGSSTPTIIPPSASSTQVLTLDLTQVEPLLPTVGNTIQASSTLADLVIEPYFEVPEGVTEVVQE